MNKLISLRLVVILRDGVPELYVSDAGCGCCCSTAPVLDGQTTSDDPQTASGQEAAELLLRVSRALARQALALGAAGLRDPLDLIREARDRLRAWGETARELWYRNPDTEVQLLHQARNLLAMAQALDTAIAAMGGETHATDTHYPRRLRD